MTPERWRQITDLFHAALAHDPARRGDFLGQADGGDAGLRRDVESLLAAHHGAGSFGDLPVSPALPLASGTLLGPYQVGCLLGVGGMGEVYRAHDPRLGRDVAVKILPPHLSGDPQRLARFEREARLLASLNHPGIGAIYGIEEFAGGRALVMELVEGEDLAERLARGPIPILEALPIARQIAEALEAAHDRGIVHRDLHPGNIKLRPDGTVKVLDFGLARAIEAATSASVPDQPLPAPSPTPPITQAGMILGTTGYMSPEQAKGHAADRRADIWAFGVVLFEMLSGDRLFTGETLADTLASVLKTEPDWRALPMDAPPGLHRLLRWCLNKDPKRRLQAIGDARRQIEELLGGVPDEAAASPPALRRRWLFTAASVVFVAGGVMAAVATWALMGPALVPSRPARFTIHTDQPLSGLNRDLALSPDGTLLVYGTGAAGGNRLFVRAIDQLEAAPLGGIAAASPFFSPDGRWIGFFSGTIGGDLQKVSITGGRPVSLGRTQGTSGGATWGSDDVILFATIPSAAGVGLLRMSAAGGDPTALSTPDARQGELSHLFPSLLPRGRAVLFTIASAGSMDNAQVAVLELGTGRQKTLIRGGSQAEFVDAPAGSGREGYLVYAAAGALRAVRFDPATLTVVGDPVTVVESVKRLTNGVAEFAVSQQGTLAYVPGDGASTASTGRSLVWVDRQGREEPIAAPLRAYNMPRLSPDGGRVAVSIGDEDLDIWIWEITRHTLTRLTDAPGEDWYPVWTSNGQRIVYASAGGDPANNNNNLFWQAADNTGVAERLTRSPNMQGPASISPDGSRLVVMENMPKTGWDMGVLRLDRPSDAAGSSLPMAGGLRPPEPLVHTAATEILGEVSPDGHWLAYQSDESGRNQVWVRPFPNVDAGHWQVSTDGGITPVWARNGRELFYFDATNAMTSVPIRTAPTFSAGAPARLFDARYVAGPFYRTYDVSRDGQRFLMIKDSAAGDQPAASSTIVVVLNWFDELQQKVSAASRSKARRP